jgi:curved DNA-binding protein CbpA
MARIPRLVSGAPSISLTADELALVDLIDGVRDEAELARQSKKSLEDVGDHLERLALLGAVAFDERARAEVIDLDATTREHFDRIYQLLGEVDHYELLGIGRDGDKKAIKAAYHRLGPAFHPDRHFRKSLGPYKQKIEAIFAALTRAHDTLRYPKKREEYDARTPARSGSPARREAIRAAIEALAPAERKGQELQPTLPPPRTTSPVPTSPVPPPLQTRPPLSSTPPTSPPLPPPRAPQPSQPTILEKPSSVPPGPERRRSFPGIPITHLDPDAAVDGRYRRATPPAMRRSSTPPKPSEATRDRQSDPGTDPRHRVSPVPQEKRVTQPSQSQPSQLQSPPPRSDPVPVPSSQPRPLEETPERKDALARKMRARAGVAIEPPPLSNEPQSRQRPAGTYQSATDVRKSAAEVVRDRFQTLGDEVRRRRLQRYLDQGRVAMAAGDFRAASAAYQQAQKLAPEDEDIAEKTAEALRRALEKL